MHESWPACGGMTSVGTTSAGAPPEKSRSRLSGVARTISCGVCHRGLRRVVVSAHQRIMSSGTSSGVRPRVRAPAQ